MFSFNNFSCRHVRMFLLVSYSGSLLPSRWLQWLMLAKIPSCLSFSSPSHPLLSTYYVSGTVPSTCHTSDIRLGILRYIISFHLSTKSSNILNTVKTTTAGQTTLKSPCYYIEVLVLTTSQPTVERVRVRVLWEGRSSVFHNL